MCFAGCFSCSFSHRFGCGFGCRYSSFCWCSNWRFGGFASQTFCFALTATHFTWIVRCPTAAADCWCFRYHDLGGRRRSGNHCRFCNNLCDCSWCFDNSRSWCDLSHFSNRRLADFGGRVACSFCGRRFSNRLCGFRCGNFAWRFRLGCCWSCFNGCFGAFVSCANGGAYCCCGDGIAGIGCRFCSVFAAFDRVAIGVALALAAIAATTLTTGAATWTIATFIPFLLIVLHCFFSVQCFVGGSSLFGAWLTLFTWLTRLTRLTLWAFGTHFFSCACVITLRGIQWLTQFTWLTLFTRLALTWLTLFTRWA